MLNAKMLLLALLLPVAALARQKKVAVGEIEAPRKLQIDRNVLRERIASTFAAPLRTPMQR
jgi:hypothetical protein